MPQSGIMQFHLPRSAREALGPFAELVGLATRRRRIGGFRVYVGQGQPVLVLPEFAGGPETTASLRSLLRAAGFAVHDWGLGTDHGPTDGLDRLIRRLEERIIDVYEAERAPVTLLGCDLSGIYAREAAKRTTPIVRQVITVGSPVRAHDPQGRCAMLRTLFSPAARVDAPKINRLRQRPPVSCTSIYSVTDEAVPASLAEEPESLTTENVMVPARRHADLLRHPKTIAAITERLARPAQDRDSSYR